VEQKAVSEEQVDLDRAIKAHEAATTEALNALRLLDEQWAEYRHLMRESSTAFQRAGAALDTTNYEVQKDLASRREVDDFVRRLADEHMDALEQLGREFRSDSDAELERLRREKAGA
jgi:hemerythrin-like domain-containing protein